MGEREGERKGLEEADRLITKLPRTPSLTQFDRKDLLALATAGSYNPRLAVVIHKDSWRCKTRGGGARKRWWINRVSYVKRDNYCC